MPTKKNPETETKSAPKTEVKTSKPAGGNKRAPLMPTTIFAETGTLGKWKLIDAAGQTLGRLSTQIAVMLMGKQIPATHATMTPEIALLLLTPQKYVSRVKNGTIKSTITTQGIRAELRNIQQNSSYPITLNGWLNGLYTECFPQATWAVNGEES